MFGLVDPSLCNIMYVHMHKLHKIYSHEVGLWPFHLIAVDLPLVDSLQSAVRRRRSADALSVDTKGRLPLHWAALHGRGALLASVGVFVAEGGWSWLSAFGPLNLWASLHLCF